MGNNFHPGKRINEVRDKDGFIIGHCDDKGRVREAFSGRDIGKCIRCNLVVKEDNSNVETVSRFVQK